MGLKSLTVPFIENKGQVNKEVAYYAKTFGGTVFVTKKGEIVYSLPKREKAQDVNCKTPGSVYRYVALKETFVGLCSVKVKGDMPTMAHVNYFRGKTGTNGKRTFPHI